MERIKLTSLGPITEADISFGDLTVFVGENKRVERAFCSNL